MIGLLTFLWYCCDDWLAVALRNPILGDIPLPIILVAEFLVWFVIWMIASLFTRNNACA